jgi:hypothetical protein
MNAVEKRTPQEFAKNYPLAPKDGRYPNIAIGNITEFNGRYIINVCLKTAKSGDVGASMSYPVEWGLKVQTGQHMDVLIEDGYVKKLLSPVMSKTISIIEASNSVVQDTTLVSEQSTELVVAKGESSAVAANS